VNVQIVMDDDAVEEIARRAAEIVMAHVGEKTKQETPSPYMTIRETAEYLRCPRQRIDNLLSARRLTRIKDGGRTLLDRNEVEQYLGRDSRHADR
jgi:excisionase family DNA binding protein